MDTCIKKGELIYDGERFLEILSVENGQITSIKLLPEDYTPQKAIIPSTIWLRYLKAALVT